MQYFYAYHGPNNDTDFEPLNGYGVTELSKLKKVEVGDMLFVIQKRKECSDYELCGLYQISGKYKKESNEKPFRVELTATHATNKRIAIDQVSVGDRLPEVPGKNNWTNFQRHFCSQGASFRKNLDPAVVAVLMELLGIPDRSHSECVALPTEESVFVEGGMIEVFVNRFERDPKARSECIRLRGAICFVCGFDFNKQYGALAESFIHVHHLLPLSKIRTDYVVNPKTDLIPVCPNCHAMIHKLGVHPDELKKEIVISFEQALKKSWGDD